MIPLPNMQQVYQNTHTHNQQIKSADKVMMIIFIDHKSVMCKHAVPPKISMKSEYYVLVLKIF